MGKLGYLFVLFGILLIMMYGLYIFVSDFSIPIPIKIAILAIIIGIVIIIIHLIIERRKERTEEDDSSKY